VGGRRESDQSDMVMIGQKLSGDVQREKFLNECVKQSDQSVHTSRASSPCWSVARSTKFAYAHL
jgi:hypothetical protein